MTPIGLPALPMGEPTLTEARERLEMQDAMLLAVAEPLGAAIMDRVHDQEDALRSVYAPLVAEAESRVASQEAALSDIVSRMHEYIRARVESQQVRLDQVRDILIAMDAADPACGLAPEPVPTVSPVIIGGITYAPVGVSVQGGQVSSPGGLAVPFSGGTGGMLPAMPPVPGQGQAVIPPGHHDPGRSAGGLAHAPPDPIPGLAPAPPPMPPAPPGPPAPRPMPPAGPIARPGRVPPGRPGQPSGGGSLAAGGGGTGGGSLAPVPPRGSLPDDEEEFRGPIQGPPERGVLGWADNPVLGRKRVGPALEMEKEPDSVAGFADGPAEARFCGWAPLARGWPALISQKINSWKAIEDVVMAFMDAVSGDAWALSLVSGIAAALQGSYADIASIAIYNDSSREQCRRVYLTARHVLACLHGYSAQQERVLLTLLVVRAYVQAASAQSVTQAAHPLRNGSFSIELGMFLEQIDGIIRFICPQGVPSPSEAVGLYLADAIPEARLVQLAAWHGVPADVIRATARAQRTRLSIDGQVRDWLAWRTPPDEIRRRLRTLGVTDDDDAAAIMRTAQFMPPPGDLISFAVKDVFSPEKIGLEEMRREYAGQEGLKDALATQGIGPVAYRTEAGEVVRRDWGEAYWLAHYRNVSPTQAFEMLHRLRPERVAKFAIPGPGGRPVAPQAFTLADVEALLKEDDYNPVHRRRLAAISYHVLGRIDLRRVYLSGGFGEVQGQAGFNVQVPGEPRAIAPAEREVVATLQDGGYTLLDASRMAYWMAGEADRVKAAKPRAAAVKDAVSLYGLGAFPREEAAAALKRLDVPDDEARALLEHEEWRLTMAEVRAGIATVRKQFRQGLLDANAVKASLHGVGVQHERVEHYVRLWTMQLQAQEKEADAGRMCQWYAQGLITLGEMHARLIRLGWTEVDARRAVRHCELGIAAKGAAAAAKRAKAEEKRRQAAVKAAAAERTRREKEEAKRRAKANAAHTDKNLVAFWMNRSLTKQEVREALYARGWLGPDVERWIKAYLVRKEKGNGSGSGAAGGGE